MKKFLLALLLAALPLSLLAASGTAIPGGSHATAFVIDKPGSYYLAGNRTMTVTNAWTAIQIWADNVTLDLNGFTLGFSATTGEGIGGGHAIHCTGENVEVRNGTIDTTPGPAVRAEQCYGFRLIDVRVLNTKGLYIVGSGSVIDRCNITNSRSYGIYMAGSGSIARNCVVTDVSSSTGLTNGIGINMGASCHAVGCTVAHTDGSAIECGHTSVIEDCKITGGNLDKNAFSGGIYLTSGYTTVRRNVITGSYGTGIYVPANASHVVVDENVVYNSAASSGDGVGIGIWSRNASTILRANMGGSNDGGFIVGQHVNGGGNLGN